MAADDRQSAYTVPTGFSPHALPFHNKLDDGEFEQFCTDLLNRHPSIHCLRHGKAVSRKIVDVSHLQSGTKQHGADIWAKDERGEVWIFQCKRVKEFEPGDVSKAIELAELGHPHAEQLVLITTCGLSANALRLIHDNPKWMWWDSSRLTAEAQKLQPVEHGITLVKRYFGLDWVKALFPWGDQPLLTWQEFFERDLAPERKHFHHRSEFISREPILDQLVSFATKGAGKALILSAAGGQGKSRLLLELARRLEHQPDSFRVRFLNLGSAGLQEADSDYLKREGNFLLVVDDAHRLVDGLGSVAAAASQVESIRLLVATRSQAIEAVTSQLYTHGFAERLEPRLNLKPWKVVELQALAEKLLHRPDPARAAELVQLSDRCPLLVVLGAAQLNDGQWPGTMPSTEAFREMVMKGFIEGFLRSQSHAKHERLRRLIQLVSFISPSPRTEALLGQAAKVLDCSELDVAEDLESLLGAGLLIENREGVRVYPDLLADALVLDASLDSAGHRSLLLAKILNYLPIIEFPALVRNLAQADWEVEATRGESNSIFERVWQGLVDRYRESSAPDRRSLLHQWATIAIFQPKRSLELARLALDGPAPKTEMDELDAMIQPRPRDWVITAIPDLLKPVAAWHPRYARQALDLLWEVACREADAQWENSSTAIAAIADAAKFEPNKHLDASKLALDWMEGKLVEPATTELLRKRPWILSALLKPFFETIVERHWSVGMTVHFAAVPVALERTRPLRQRALVLIERFLTSNDVALALAAWHVLRKATEEIESNYGHKPNPNALAHWRADRLEAVKVIGRCLQRPSQSPVVATETRRRLRDLVQHEDDEIVRGTAADLFARVPDSFELRLLRVLGSWAHEEYPIESTSNPQEQYSRSEERWNAFCREVARESRNHFENMKAVCQALRGWVQEFRTANLACDADRFLAALLEESPTGTAALLDELTGASDDTLDGFLRPVIEKATGAAPEAYAGLLESLPRTGRTAQICCLIRFLGWKHVHGGGLTASERQALLESASNSDDVVIETMAHAVSSHFRKDLDLGPALLSHLNPRSERSTSACVQCLGWLVKENPGNLDSSAVQKCLDSLGHRLFMVRPSSADPVRAIARAFPRLVYEHARGLVESGHPDAACASLRIGLRGHFPLGRFDDVNYLDRELSEQWQKSLAGGTAVQAHLALVRSLLWSDLTSAPERIRELLEKCRSAADMEALSTLVARPGSNFALEFPDLVRRMLVRAEDLGALVEIRQSLIDSVLGGAREFTNGELGPLYRHILDRAEALATRHRDDPHQGALYKAIASGERQVVEGHRQQHRMEVEALE